MMHNSGMNTQRSGASRERGAAYLCGLCLAWLVVPVLLAAAGVNTPVLTGRAYAAGVPEAVYQDSERTYRRAPKAGEGPQVQVGPRVNLGIALKPEDQAPRAAAAPRNAVAGSAYTTEDTAGRAETRLLAAEDWRLRIRQAAVSGTEMVLLGDIAVPLGTVPPETWAELSARELWPAPPEEGKPLQVNKSRLSQALRKALGPELARRCLLPASLTVQRGGVVFREEDLRQYVVNSLTPLLSSLPGKVELTDFRLPPFIFLDHPQQQIQLEPGRLTPGRMPLRFAVQETDGRIVRRVAGTVNVDVWLEVPAAARPLARGEALGAQDVTFIRMNAAKLRATPWDGLGGPWQAARPLNEGEPLLQGDLLPQTTLRKGSVVTLYYERGAVRMQTRAEALEDGAPGATIAVRNLQSKKQVYAIVRDAASVVIQ